MPIFLIQNKSYYLAIDYILKDRNFPEVDSKYFTAESCLQEYCCPYIYYMFLYINSVTILSKPQVVSHPVSVLQWGLLNPPGKMLHF